MGRSEFLVQAGLDGGTGRLQVAYASLPGPAATGDGVLLLLSILGLAPGTSLLSLDAVVVSDAGVIPGEIFVTDLQGLVITVVPEPSTLLLLGVGLVGLGRRATRAR